jgi:hypothetical protein
MGTLRIRPTTIQIVGTLVSIFVGICGGYLARGESPDMAVAIGLILSLLCEILTFNIDIYYGALGDGRTFQDAMKSSPILRHYEDCVLHYAVLKRDLAGNGDIGNLMSSWLDEKVQLHFREADNDWKNGRLRFRQDELAVRSVQSQKCVRYGGFATQLERSTGFWETAQEYLEDTRDLARRGRSITRVFILNSPGSLENEALASQITKDKESGIVTLIAYMDALNIEAIHDFAIYDEKFVSFVSMTPIGARVTGCSYSMRPEDVRMANTWKDQILRHAMAPPALPAA